MPFVQASAAMGRVLAEHHPPHVVARTPAVKAKRGDVVVFAHKKVTSYVHGPNETRTEFTVGEVTSASRDGQVREFRDYQAGAPRKVEHAGLEHADRYLIPGDRIDKAGVEELVRSRGVLAGSGNYKPFESLEEVHAALKPHVRGQKKEALMDVITKSVEAAVIPVDSDSDAGEFEVVLSTGALDRDGERLHAEEWKQPLPARIHFDSDHGMSIEKTVGSGIPRIEDGRLMVRGTYAKTPHAQMVRQLVNDGHVTSTSVTFQNIKTEKDASPQRELLNGAFVAVPANPEAVVLSSKAFADEGKKAARDFLVALKQFGASGNNPVTHDGMVQAIHDAAYHLGAQCASDIEADDGEDEGANKSAALAALVKEGLLTKSEIREDFDLSKTSSTKNAGTPQESPDDSPAEAATKAAADAPAKVPAKAADDSADAAEALATSAKALEYLISKNFKEQ